MVPPEPDAETACSPDEEAAVKIPRNRGIFTVEEILCKRIHCRLSHK